MNEQMTQVKVEVQGTYDDRFRAVYDVLERQLNNGDDIGSSAAVFIDGEPWSRRKLIEYGLPVHNSPLEPTIGVVRGGVRVVRVALTLVGCRLVLRSGTGCRILHT